MAGAPTAGAAGLELPAGPGFAPATGAPPAVDPAGVQAPTADVCFAVITGDNITDFSSADAQAVRAAVGNLTTGGSVKLAGTCAGAISQDGANQVALITKAFVAVTNTIVTSHAVGISNAGGVVSQNYGLFFGNGANMAGAVSGDTGSITGNPVFANVAANDYRITAPSAARNAGVLAGVLVVGEPRWTPP